MSEYLKKYVSKIENKFENKLVYQSRMLTHFNRVLNLFDNKEITKKTSFIIIKSKIYWKVPFKFWLASHLPFKNHTYKNYPIPKFIRGHSTGMLSICNR